MPSILRTNFTLAGTVLLAFAAIGHAQTVESPDESQPAKVLSPVDAKRAALRNRDHDLDPLRTYRLQAGSAPNDANELLTGLRQMLNPSCKLYLVPSENIIMLRCDEAQLLLADQIVHELDKPKPNYRLTYTVVESENGKRIGVQHFAMAMIPGARTTLKDGSKVPVATGSYSSGNTAAQTQFTYVDVGLNFDATLTVGAGGLLLKSNIEQSASAEDRTIAGVTEPIIRQAVLTGSSTLQVGKPLTLGSLDVAASTRHLDVEVLLELVK